MHKPGLGPCSQAYHTPWAKPPFNIDATARKRRPGRRVRPVSEGALGPRRRLSEAVAQAVLRD